MDTPAALAQIAGGARGAEVGGLVTAAVGQGAGVVDVFGGGSADLTGVAVAGEDLCA